MVMKPQTLRFVLEGPCPFTLNLLGCAYTRNETETFLSISSSVNCNQLLWFEAKKEEKKNVCRV